MKNLARKAIKRIVVPKNDVRTAIVETYVKHKGQPTMEDIIEAMEEYCGMNRIEYVVDDPFEYDSYV